MSLESAPRAPWLLPLFLLACAYDLCAGDRETGALRMVLAQGTSPWRWIGQRALVRGAPMLVLACLATILAGMIGDQGGLESRVLLALAVVVAYGLFWVAIAALVNGFARSAAAAATAAGALWVVFVLVLSTLLNIAVESLHPSPARSEGPGQGPQGEDSSDRDRVLGDRRRCALRDCPRLGVTRAGVTLPRRHGY